jgi:murein DD-endopeptidase MepM/ murein hydrolase activator NlpD
MPRLSGVARDPDWTACERSAPLDVYGCVKGAQQLIGSEVCRPGRPRTMAVIVAALGLAASASQATTFRAPANNPLLTPVAPACVSSPFGPRILPNKPLAGNFHDGIDLPAAIGAPVIAVAPGTVIRIQRHGVGGLEVLIQHDGFIGIYSHLGLIAPILAEGGKAIYGGERIATVGRTGLTYGPHLYFGMIVNGHSVDPAPYLNVVPCGSGTPVPQDARIRPTRLFAQH